MTTPTPTRTPADIVAELRDSVAGWADDDGLFRTFGRHWVRARDIREAADLIERLTRENDAMIAAGLGARIDASVDDGSNLQKMQTAPDGATPPADGGWQGVESAPKDAAVLLYGILDPHPDSVALYGNLTTPMRAVGYWDEIDGAWCPVGSTWLGPWFKPTHYRPLPSPPLASQPDETAGG